MATMREADKEDIETLSEMWYSLAEMMESIQSLTS